MFRITKQVRPYLILLMTIMICGLLYITPLLDNFGSFKDIFAWIGTVTVCIYLTLYITKIYWPKRKTLKGNIELSFQLILVGGLAYDWLELMFNPSQFSCIFALIMTILVPLQEAFSLNLDFMIEEDKEKEVAGV